MALIDQTVTPPPEGTTYARQSPAQAAADAIPILVDDTYHIFHLTTPPYTRHHPPRLRSSWSRLQSRDLVSWTRDPKPVLVPGSHASDPDADGIWTGAATIAPDGCMNIFYTGYNLAQNGKQVILRTRSQDRHGSAFEQPGTEIIIEGDGLSQYEDIDFRDPYVFFNEQERKYWMLVATRLRTGPHWTRGCIALLTSPNLDRWTVEPQPLYAPNDILCPECPELFTLGNGMWYLLYSRFHAPNAGTVYRVATSPRGPFRIPRDGSHGRLDGRRWYAAKSCPKFGDPDKRISFGWIGDYVDEEEKWLWGGDLGVPRELVADSQGNLQVQIASEVVHHLEKSYLLLPERSIPSSARLSCIGATAMMFPDLNLVDNADVYMTFSVASSSAHSFGIVLQADQQDKGYRIQFSPSSEGGFTVSLLIDFPALDDFWADQYKLFLPRGVDGPELIRHESVDVSAGASLLLKGQTVQMFSGGRAISFRLPLPCVSPSGASEGGLKRPRPLGWFVEDGEVELENIMIRVAGGESRL